MFVVLQEDFKCDVVLETDPVIPIEVSWSEISLSFTAT